MAYERKTRDEFDIEQLFPDGWEVVTCEETYAAAREQAKCYRENQPEYRVRITKRRVRIEETATPKIDAYVNEHVLHYIGREVMMPSGGIRLTTFVGHQLISQMYFDYDYDECEQMFRNYVLDIARAAHYYVVYQGQCGYINEVINFIESQSEYTILRMAKERGYKSNH